MKKLQLYSIVTVAFALTVSTVSNGNALFAQFGGGNGTQANPYQISTKQHLEALANLVNSSNNWSNGKYFKVMNDITDSVRTSIGSGIRSFQGNFNGNNKKITLAINHINTDYTAGLFGYVNKGTLENIIVDGYVKSTPNAGGIVGCIYQFASLNTSGDVAIINCFNIASITVDGKSNGHDGAAGGIVGCINPFDLVNCVTIINCSNIGTISGEGFAYHGVGGIIGNVWDNNTTTTTISNCINSGLIKGINVVLSTGIGGIIGSITTSTNLSLSNCINTGVIIKVLGGGASSNNYSSGIIGNTVNNTIYISNCYYDKQMCIYGGIDNADITGQAEGKLTEEMTGTQLQSKLGTTNFTYSKKPFFS